MFSRMLAGLLAVLFVVFVGRWGTAFNQASQRLLIIAVLLAVVLAISLVPRDAVAGPAFADGARVRITAGSIEAGWHHGRVQRDQRKCWVVLLDKATQEGYTLLALLVVDELQVARGAGWAAVAVRPVVNAQRPECLEQGSD